MKAALVGAALALAAAPSSVSASPDVVADRRDREPGPPPTLSGADGLAAGELPEDASAEADTDALGDASLGSLADADAESRAIAARLRERRSARDHRAYWPRLVVSLRLGPWARDALGRAAGVPDRWAHHEHGSLVWSVTAVWGEP